jgi:hypothetical protein
MRRAAYLRCGGFYEHAAHMPLVGLPYEGQLIESCFLHMADWERWKTAIEHFHDEWSSFNSDLLNYVRSHRLS